MDKSDNLVKALQEGRIGRREFLKRATALGLTLPAAGALLAACGGGGEEAAPAPPATTEAPEPAPAETTAPATTEASGEPTPGGTLLFARNFEPVSLYPFASSDNGSIFAMVQLYDGLVNATPEGVGPGLAESWEGSEDGLTWTFHLREAKFSNGDPVTAADAKFSLDRFADPEINTIIPSLAFGFDSVEAPDDRTVVIHLQHPVGALFENLSVFPGSITSQKWVEAQPDDDWKNPVGTGPFMVKEWVPGDHITMERNPNYWEEGKPYVDEVRFDYVADDNARMLRVQSGEAHLGEGVPFSQVQALQGTEGLTVEVKTIARYEGIFLNHKRKPFEDLDVRKALNLATDKEAINQAVYGGVAELANDMIPKGRFTADPATIPPYPFDLAQAQSLMASSSGASGFDATFIYPAGSSIHKELATIIQAQWAELGVNVKPEEVDQASLFDRYLGGDWDVAVPLVQFTADVTVNDEVAVLFYDVNVEANAIAAFATGWPVPQELYDLTQQAAKAATEEERAQLWPQAQQIAMDQAPWVALFFLPAVTAVRNEVQGFQTLPAAWWDLEEVSLNA